MTDDRSPTTFAPRAANLGATLDPERAELRQLLASIGARLDTLAAAAPDDPTIGGAHADLAALVAILRLGPEPEVRSCPSCGNVGMRLATRCGFCWTTLTPPGAAATAP